MIHDHFNTNLCVLQMKTISRFSGTIFSPALQILTAKPFVLFNVALVYSFLFFLSLMMLMMLMMSMDGKKYFQEVATPPFIPLIDTVVCMC